VLKRRLPRRRAIATLAETGAFLTRMATALAAAFVVLAALNVGLGMAERSGRDGVVASLDGSVSPKSLPRHRSVPVALTLTGSIHSETAPPPQLASLELAFGTRGGLTTAGLPRCRGTQLRNATQRQAREMCGDALVGQGRISSEVLLNPEDPVPAHASVLAFNGELGGKPVVWLHAYSASPPVSFALPFSLRHLGAGSYGISLRTPVSSTLGRWLRLRTFRITIGRRYSVHGAQRSYLSANCPLPPRFHSLDVPLARATYRFTPGPTLNIPISRWCSVRE